MASMKFHALKFNRSPKCIGFLGVRDFNFVIDYTTLFFKVNSKKKYIRIRKSINCMWIGIWTAGIAISIRKDESLQTEEIVN